jgi:hypothetical protein
VLLFPCHQFRNHGDGGNDRYEDLSSDIVVCEVVDRAFGTTSSDLRVALVRAVHLHFPGL